MRLSPEELLAELGWLRRLARSLVGTAAVDEDLVQETWLAAQRIEGGVSRPWLVGTLRRLAARWHRDQSRSRRREAAVARPEGVDTEALVERSELLGLVLAQLRGLDEPFRTALLLLYQEGLSVGAAAERLGVPADTLRWQRREGIAQLRRRLDVSARLDWRAALLPLFGLPSMDPVSGGVASASSLSPLAYVGASLMSWKLILGAAAAVLAMVMTTFFLGAEGPESLAPAEVSDLEAAVSAVPLSLESMALEERAREEALVRGSASPIVAASPPPDGPTLAVSIVDPQGHPIPGARVWIGKSPDPVDGFWVSDEAGIAQVPTPTEQISFVSAVTATLYGQSPVIAERAGGEAQVVMLPDAFLTVLVVDEAGAPVEGVPVGKVGTDMRRMTLQFDSAVRTDERGLCVLRHVLDSLKFSPSSDEFRVGPLGFFLDTPSVVVSRERVPIEPVRIELPPAGALQIAVLDARGALNPAAKSIRIMLAPAAGAERDIPELNEQARFPLGGSLELQLEGGRATVPFVGLGLELMARSWRADPMNSTFGFAFGPARAGEVVTLELRPLATTTEIVGEVRDVRGELLRDAELQGGVTMKRGRSAMIPSRKIRTDGGGRFRVAVEDMQLSQWGVGMGFVLKLDHDVADPLARSRAWTALPASLEHGENDAGVLVMEALVPALTGYAFDREGSEVELTLGRVSPSKDAGIAVRRSLMEQSLVTDGNRFAVYIGALEPETEWDGALGLAVGAEGTPRQSLDAQFGERDIAVVLEEGFGLRGRLVSAVERDLSGCEVSFYSTDGQGRRIGQGWAESAKNGRFETKGLPGTPCEIEVSRFGSSDVLAFLGAVLPGSDSAVEQERLDTIRLGPPLSMYRVKAVDELGLELAGVAFEAPGSSRVTAVYGGAELIWRAPDNPLVGKLSVPGFLSQAVSLRPGGQTVTMQRGLEVVVRLATPLEHEPSEEARLVLSAADRFETIELIARGDDSFVGFVASPGSYQVRVRLLRKGLVAAEHPLDRGRIEVTAARRLQEFELP